jgi:hypothetical protein
MLLFAQEFPMLGKLLSSPSETLLNLKVQLFLLHMLLPHSPKQ